MEAGQAGKVLRAEEAEEGATVEERDIKVVQARMASMDMRLMRTVTVLEAAEDAMEMAVVEAEEEAVAAVAVAAEEATTEADSKDPEAACTL